MHPILVEIGSLKIYSYGFMLAVGAALSIILLLKQGKKEGFGEETILDLAIITIFAGVAGARLFYVLVYEWGYYRDHLLQILDLRNGGLVWYGAFIFGAAAAMLYLWRKHLPALKMLDLLVPYLALGYAFGRIGCFLNGCCYGKPTSVPWAVVFPGLDVLPRHPTQIYSSLLALGLFAFLYWLYRHRRFDGQVLVAYIIGYAGLRFVIEFFRENLIVWKNLTVAQVIAIVLMMAAVTAGGYLWRKADHSGRKR